MAARKKKAKPSEQVGQPDPRATLDIAAFLAAARPVLAQLTSDLLERADRSPAVTTALQTRHASERDAQRTADDFTTWRRSFVDQVAAAWLLSCAFVRTLEDRGLLGAARIAGPGASDSQRLYLEMAPSLTERDYLLTTFRELSRIPAAKDLFDERHNPVWLLAPSADAAKSLLQLFRTPDADAPAFRFGQADTRFLGDLYQDLNDDVKKRYALLQTPRFVESFILDRTLERAIERFGLDDTTLIDPTCGSGHFLLGAFDRFVDHRLRAEPGLDVREAARRALDQVFGADINPYAVAIARFRLTLAFLEKAGYQKLDQSPALGLHLVVADSLLHNPHVEQLELGDRAGTSVAAWKGEQFALEDEAAARDVLYRRYAAVVGNPPYITVKDAVLREKYRAMYPSAFRTYSMGVPFTERFFQLGRDGAYVGVITANSFMKREFGRKLVEEYLPSRNLDLIVNTSGAFIPGHGTPTVMLFGSNESAVDSAVRVILASRGEPTTPTEPELGVVWRSIADHWNESHFENEFITVSDAERSALAKHPWSLGGGGASELKELLEERASTTLKDIIDGGIGRAARTGEDEVYMYPTHVAARLGIGEKWWMDLLVGEAVRDWGYGALDRMLFPYDRERNLEPASDTDPTFASALKFLWPFKTRLAVRTTFQGTMRDAGLQWYEYMQYTPSAHRTDRSIAFAFVATHNHFVLDRGGKVFNRSAPIIKLPESATEDDHYALLAYLNSSTACFWMKQVIHKKSSASQKHHTDPARAAYEFAGTALEGLPVPSLSDLRDAVPLCRELETRARERMQWSGKALETHASSIAWTKAALNQFFEQGWLAYEEATARAVYLQEELDWFIYGLFNLASGTDPSPVTDGRAALGARPFEHTSGYVDGVSERARTSKSETIGTRPEHWTARIAALSEEHVRVIETAEFKRMWRDTERNVDQQEYRSELPREWLEREATEIIERSLSRKSQCTSCGGFVDDADVTDRVSGIADFFSEETAALVRRLASTEAVPFLATQRLHESGVEKLTAWEETWSLQRREDAGENVGEIPVPPKYDQKDFRDANTWRLRGKLDVPKERFISYPGCESDEDHEPVYGWAGWDHAQRARALGTLYFKRKTEEGWPKERLTPMLAGLLELLPWLHQWHSEPNEDYGGQSPGQYFDDFLNAQCSELGLTDDDLRAWRPAEKTRGARRTARKKSDGD